MAKFKADLYGDREMILFLRRFSTDVAKEIHNATLPEMQTVASTAKAKAPKATGMLAASGQGPNTKWHDKGTAFTIEIRYTRPNSDYIEAAGKRRRFLRNAYRKQAKRIRQRAWEAILSYWQRNAPKPKR